MSDANYSQEAVEQAGVDILGKDVMADAGTRDFLFGEEGIVRNMWDRETGGDVTLGVGRTEIERMRTMDRRGRAGTKLREVIDASGAGQGTLWKRFTQQLRKSKGQKSLKDMMRDAAKSTGTELSPAKERELTTILDKIGALEERRRSAGDAGRGEIDAELDTLIGDAGKVVGHGTLAGGLVAGGAMGVEAAEGLAATANSMERRRNLARYENKTTATISSLRESTAARQDVALRERTRLAGVDALWKGYEGERRDDMFIKLQAREAAGMGFNKRVGINFLSDENFKISDKEVAEYARKNKVDEYQARQQLREVRATTHLEDMKKKMSPGEWDAMVSKRMSAIGLEGGGLGTITADVEARIFGNSDIDIDSRYEAMAGYRGAVEITRQTTAGIKRQQDILRNVSSSSQEKAKAKGEITRMERERQAALTQAEEYAGMGRDVQVDEQLIGVSKYQEKKYYEDKPGDRRGAINKAKARIRARADESIEIEEGAVTGYTIARQVQEANMRARLKDDDITALKGLADVEKLADDISLIQDSDMSDVDKKLIVGKDEAYTIVIVQILTVCSLLPIISNTVINDRYLIDRLPIITTGPRPVDKELIWAWPIEPLGQGPHNRSGFLAEVVDNPDLFED